MTVKDKPIQFQAIRPFGPTIIKGKLTDDIVETLDDKASEMIEDKEFSKKFNHAPNLAGNVKKEVRFAFFYYFSEAIIPYRSLAFLHDKF